MATVRVPRPPYMYTRQAQSFDDDGTDGILLADCNIQITCPEMSISSTRTEVPRHCSPVEGKRCYPRKGRHRVTL